MERTDIRKTHDSGRISWPRFVLYLVISVFIVLQSASLRSEPGKTDPTNGHRLNIGFTASTFVDINRNDALAAIKVWAEVIGERRGHVIHCDTMVFDNGASLMESLNSGQLELITLDT